MFLKLFLKSMFNCCKHVSDIDLQTSLDRKIQMFTKSIDKSLRNKQNHFFMDIIIIITKFILSSTFL